MKLYSDKFLYGVKYQGRDHSEVLCGLWGDGSKYSPIRDREVQFTTAVDRTHAHIFCTKHCLQVTFTSQTWPRHETEFITGKKLA